MNRIHPSAIIGKRVQLGDGNDIGPGCVIEDGAVLGSRNRLWMSVYVGPGTTIGDENQIHMGAVVGHQPQDLTYAGAPTATRIGDRNTIREYVTIHRGTTEGSATVIGDDNFFMANAHVAHDCRVGSKTVFANLATLAGHCVIEDEAVLAGMVVVHQFVRIGRLAMVSGLSAVTKDVPPFMLCAGRRAVIHGLNVVGLRRAGIPPSVRDELKQAYKLLYREGRSVSSALETMEGLAASAELAALVQFVKSSKRGICAGLSSASPSRAETVEPGEGASAAESLLPKKRAQARVS